MIDWLEIDQFAIVKHIELEFDSAFTAITGETGSGKSLIIDALTILLGGRCDNSVIRHQQAQAEVQGGFSIDASHPALYWLRTNGLDAENECVLRRVIRRDKSSRAFVNGRAVNASQLRELGRELVDIHGQHEHHLLLHSKGQLKLLDNAAGNNDALVELGEQYEKMSAIGAKIEQLTEHQSFAQERADSLKFQIDELETLDPQVDEWPQLAEQHKRMYHAQDLSIGANEVVARLTENESGLNTSLAECIRQLQRLVEFDARLAKVIALLEEVSINVDEAAAELQAMHANSAPNHEEIAVIEARFSRYHEFARKHRVSPELLAEKLVQMRTEHDSLQGYEAELIRLDSALREHKTKYDELAATIGTNRKRAATQLSTKVTALMQNLGMAGGNFEICLQKTTDNRISRQGNERAEFLVSANTGQPVQPLAKIASGGELSRISLAINVVLAADAPASVLVFDEVDVGIGGRVAEVVGQKLHHLGSRRQVICITHLSLVAAKAHHHWAVIKQSDEKTSVHVQLLDHELRVNEIARMTTGAKLTSESLAHAEQLLQSALK